MKAFLLVAGIAMGCEQSATTTQSVGDCEGATSESQAPFVADAGCEPSEIVQTELPIAGMGKMVAICTDCDDGGCDDLGAPCAAYGTSCDFGGEPGVCVACCNGTVGELRCSKVNGQ